MDSSQHFTKSNQYHLSDDNKSVNYNKNEHVYDPELNLAQMLSNDTIDTFPLFTSDNSNANLFGDYFAKLRECVDENRRVRWPSVSTILSATKSDKSRAALNNWKLRKTRELGGGASSFTKYQASLLDSGRQHHLNIKNFLKSRDLSRLVLNENTAGFWRSLSPLLSDISAVQMAETAGIVDCVAYYCGKLVVIEWKTTSKPKPSLADTYNDPLQAVAYMGAINWEHKHRLSIDEAVLVYAYKDGTDCQVHRLTRELCVEYWSQWLARVKCYWSSQTNMIK
ncbi:unnamed protein product [Oppiella nova]|uniref:Mitochondrial genome maintenance exonuclease 1 n=1 Tax=Oppiella nova TaxID=334625 RepID=A0A7R9QJZ6_9ACAR|nr:unnamed protein product [Oppiella nova]CAG2167452.1 unnamed protein product [Oppiella nova]